VVGVLTVIENFEALKAGEMSGEWIILFSVYAVLILFLIINVLRSLGKLKWLYKKKASRLYGVNRNAYAMDDLGGIFSGSFAEVIAFHFAYIMIPTVTVEFNMFALIALSLGVAIHFICGMSAGKVSLFSTKGETFVEEKRESGMFLPFIRNLFQIAAVGGILYYIMQSNMFKNAFTAFMNVGNANISKASEGVQWQQIAVTVWAAILPVICAIILLVTAAMLWRAMSGVEFDIEGPEAPGKKKFFGCSIAMVLAVAAFYGVQAFVQPEAAIPQTFLTQILYIGGIALAMVLIELILRPRVKDEEDPDEIDTAAYAAKYVSNTQVVYVPVQQANGAVQTAVAANAYSYGSYFDGVQPKKKISKKQKKAERKLQKERDEVTTDNYIYGQYKAAGAKAEAEMRKVEEYRAKINPKNKKRK
jgi:hypothetical protein